MSDCSSCDSSNCNTGPHISINDLPKGEQVVTTIKREDIPPPPGKCPPPLPWGAIIISIVTTVTLKTFFDIKVHVRPEIDNNFSVQIHPPTEPPSSHYPQPPSVIQPSPKLPDYYPPNPQYPSQNPSETRPPESLIPPNNCPQSEIPYCRW
jgi:hypothetical protein